MNINDIANCRLASQRIAGTEFKTAGEIVGWMGAMQAQDYSMAKWAAGVRLPGASEKAIQEACCEGEILRTHLLRPTWHFVSAEDIYWILELTAPHIKASVRLRHKELGLTAAVIKKCDAVIERALADGRHLTREEIAGELGKAKIPSDSSRLYHLLLAAELEGIICSGAVKGKDHTYALLAERSPKKKTVGRDEALGELAKRYFTSHGPATVHDFAWWSGLSVADTRRGVEIAKPYIISENEGSREYWFAKAQPFPDAGKEDVYLLPAFDEFIISYRDRSAALPLENQSRAVSSNGVFRPVIVVNGQVAGIWKRITKKKKTVVEARFFKPPDKKTRKGFEQEVAAYGRYLAQNTEILLGIY